MALWAGFMLVVQPNVVRADRGKGVQTGELLVVNDAGHERLHKVPSGLLSGGH
jgi:hypothetical protein